MKLVEKVKAALANPAVRSALYRVAAAVLSALAVKYAIDGNLVAILNAVLAAVFGIADANVARTPAVPADEPAPSAPESEAQPDPAEFPEAVA